MNSKQQRAAFEAWLPNAYRQHQESYSVFELVQDGIPVASAVGSREEAWRMIQHYAAVYSQDGPVEIYEIIRRRVEGDGK